MLHVEVWVTFKICIWGTSTWGMESWKEFGFICLAIKIIWDEQLFVIVFNLNHLWEYVLEDNYTI